MKNLKELPKLPRGMGSYSYENNGDIRYRKMINGRTISVTVNCVWILFTIWCGNTIFNSSFTVVSHVLFEYTW